MNSPTPVTVPRLVAIVLAAGQSERFGGDKRRTALADQSADTLLTRSVRNLLPHVTEVVLALKTQDRGHEQQLCQDLYNHPQLTIVYAEHARQGLSGSLKDAVSAVDTETVDGLIVALADMPFVQVSTFAAIIAQWQADKIVRPFYVEDAAAPQAGNPILFGRHWIPALFTCDGDAGARHLLRDNPHAIVKVCVSDYGVLRDIDRPADLS